MWVLGTFHDFLIPLKFSVSVHFGQLRELPVFQHGEKGGKLFSEETLKHHLGMVPSSSPEVTTGLS